MPVTQQRSPAKRVDGDDQLKDLLTLGLPFKIHNRNFRVSLPSFSSDEDLDADSEDQTTPSPASGKLSRRRSSTGYRSGSGFRTNLYCHLDAFSRYFIENSSYSRSCNSRILNSQYLTANSKFVGQQQSGCARYEIKVEFKSVDLLSSVVTGFFYISGLTDEHPLITTCFKGEIINNPLSGLEGAVASRVKKYSFITEEKNWSSFPKNDLDHWKKLTGSPANFTEDELRMKLQQIQSGNDDPLLIYMRWKEEFLVPDSRIKLLTGASFEGFYYIVLNVGSSADRIPTSGEDNCRLPPGTMNGLYFYTQSEKFQSLSLRYVEERGVKPLYNFV